jgi:hypothetical protein
MIVLPYSFAGAEWVKYADESGPVVPAARFALSF